MRRLIVNRWWALILALVLSATGVATLSAVGYADGGAQLGEPGGGGSGGGGPTGSGDPDIPINTGKTMNRQTAARPGRAGVFGAGRGGVGDATGAQLVWLFRYRMALQVFRTYVLRF